MIGSAVTKHKYSTFSAALVVTASLTIGAAPGALAASFPQVVRAVLDSQTDGRLAKMGRDQRARMTDCVIATLAGLPGGKKRYIAEGASLDEQQDRFGEVVQEEGKVEAEDRLRLFQDCGRTTSND